MFKILCAAAVSAFAILPAHAVSIVQWDFEGATTPPDLSNSTVSPAVAASLGTGSAQGVHADAATDWTTPAGNGSANSLSSNTWNVGDYYQFSFSSLGYSGLMVTLDQTGSSTGPRDFTLAWSTNGSTFNNVSSYSLVGTPAWNSTTPSAVHTYSFNLSAISALDDQASVVIRLVNSSTTSIGGATVAAGGTGRVDNFTVMATPVPEAGTAAMLAAGLAVIGFVARRRA